MDPLAHPNLLRNKLTQEMRLSLAFLAVLALLPLGVTSPYWLGVLIVSMYFAMLACGWNLLAGYAGQFSLAPAAFAIPPGGVLILGRAPGPGGRQRRSGGRG